MLQSGIFYPILPQCGQVIPIPKLKALEDRVIKKFPNSLNRVAYRRATYTSVQGGTGVLHVHDKRSTGWQGETSMHGSVQITVWACGADGST